MTPSEDLEIFLNPNSPKIAVCRLIFTHKEYLDTNELCLMIAANFFGDFLSSKFHVYLISSPSQTQQFENNDSKDFLPSNH